MQTTLRLTARVQAGHKIEIIALELTEGEEVTVVVTQAGNVAARLDMLPATPLETRIAFARHLLGIGAISAVPPGRSGPPPEPIIVSGSPVSETVIEERG